MSILTFFFVLLSAFLHASWNVAGKKIAHITTIPWYGFILSGLLLSPVFLIQPVQINNVSMVVFCLLLSTLIHVIYILSLFKAYEKWDVSVVYPIVRSTGVMICAIASIWFFKEKLSLLGLSGIGLIILGIIIKALLRLNKGNSLNIDSQTIPSAIFVGLCVGSYLIVDRTAIQYIQPIHYIVLLNLLMGLTLTPYFILKKPDLCIEALKHYKKYIGIIGFSAAGSYLLILWVFSYSIFGYVASLRELSILFALSLGYLFLKEKINKQQLISISCLIIGAILIKLG